MGLKETLRRLLATSEQLHSFCRKQNLEISTECQDSHRRVSDSSLASRKYTSGSASSLEDDPSEPANGLAEVSELFHRGHSFWQ